MNKNIKKNNSIQKDYIKNKTNSFINKLPANSKLNFSNSQINNQKNSNIFKDKLNYNESTTSIDETIKIDEKNDLDKINYLKSFYSSTYKHNDLKFLSNKSINSNNDYYIYTNSEKFKNINYNNLIEVKVKNKINTNLFISNNNQDEEIKFKNPLNNFKSIISRVDSKSFEKKNSDENISLSNQIKVLTLFDESNNNSGVYINKFYLNISTLEKSEISEKCDNLNIASKNKFFNLENKNNGFNNVDINIKSLDNSENNKSYFIHTEKVPQNCIDFTGLKEKQTKINLAQKEFKNKSENLSNTFVNDISDNHINLKKDQEIDMKKNFIPAPLNKNIKKFCEKFEINSNESIIDEIKERNSVNKSSNFSNKKFIYENSPLENKKNKNLFLIKSENKKIKIKNFQNLKMCKQDKFNLFNNLINTNSIQFSNDYQTEEEEILFTNRSLKNLNTNSPIQQNQTETIDSNLIDKTKIKFNDENIFNNLIFSREYFSIISKEKKIPNLKIFQDDEVNNDINSFINEDRTDLFFETNTNNGNCKNISNKTKQNIKVFTLENYITGKNNFQEIRNKFKNSNTNSQHSKTKSLNSENFLHNSYKKKSQLKLNNLKSLDYANTIHVNSAHLKEFPYSKLNPIFLKIENDSIDNNIIDFYNNNKYGKFDKNNETSKKNKNEIINNLNFDLIKNVQSPQSSNAMRIENNINNKIYNIEEINNSNPFKISFFDSNLNTFKNKKFSINENSPSLKGINKNNDDIITNKILIEKSSKNFDNSEKKKPNCKLSNHKIKKNTYNFDPEFQKNFRKNNFPPDFLKIEENIFHPIHKYSKSTYTRNPFDSLNNLEIIETNLFSCSNTDNKFYNNPIKNNYNKYNLNEIIEKLQKLNLEKICLNTELKNTKEDLKIKASDILNFKKLIIEKSLKNQNDKKKLIELEEQIKLLNGIIERQNFHLSKSSKDFNKIKNETFVVKNNNTGNLTNSIMNFKGTFSCNEKKLFYNTNSEASRSKGRFKSFTSQQYSNILKSMKDLKKKNF